MKGIWQMKINRNMAILGIILIAIIITGLVFIYASDGQKVISEPQAIIIALNSYPEYMGDSYEYNADYFPNNRTYKVSIYPINSNSPVKEVVINGYSCRILETR